MTAEQLQCLLGALGDYTLRRRDGSLAIDGISGPATRRAILDFQKRRGLPETGTADEITRQALLKAVGSGLPSRESAGPGSVWKEPEVKPYFKRSEFACPCPRCGGFPAEPHPVLVRACAAVRREANRRRPGTAFLISSGVRCQAHNDELPGSVPDSRHVRGRAVDFSLPGFSPRETLELARGTPGIVFAYIMPSGWVHMDIGN